MDNTIQYLYQRVEVQSPPQKASPRTHFLSRQLILSPALHIDGVKTVPDARSELTLSTEIASVAYSFWRPPLVKHLQVLRTSVV
jgi:hypothetical protein